MSRPRLIPSRSSGSLKPVTLEAAWNTATVLYAAALCAAFSLFFLFPTGRLGANWSTGFLAILFVAGLRHIGMRALLIETLRDVGGLFLKQGILHVGALLVTEFAVAKLPWEPQALVAAGAWTLYWPILLSLGKFFMAVAGDQGGRVTRGSPLSSRDHIASRLGLRSRR